MELIKHNTPESILSMYWHLEKNGLTIEEFLQCEGGGKTADGEDVSFTGADELQAIKDNGFWGYCDSKNGKVHVWIGEGADPETIIFFLGHELGHAAGQPVEDSGDELADAIAEESRADQYGVVTRQAYVWLKELLGEKEALKQESQIPPAEEAREIETGAR